MQNSKLLVAIMAAAVESVLAITLGSQHLPTTSMRLMFFCLLVLNLGAVAVYQFIVYPNLLSPLRHLPSPKGGYPLVGNHLVLFEAPPGQTMAKWMEEIGNDGLIRFQGIWHQDMLLVTSPAALAEILVSKTYMFEKPAYGRDHLRHILGNGLVVVEGDVHKFQRKHVMPSFSFRNIKDLYGLMWVKSQNLCDRLGVELQESDSVSINITDWAARGTLDVIGVAGLGRDFNSLYNDEDELAQLYKSLSDPKPSFMFVFAIAMLFGPDILRPFPLPAVKYIKHAAQRLREICRQLVIEKRQAIEKHGDDHYDILSCLVKSNDFNDDELVDQMLTFLAAGSDTTSLTLTWTCYMLAKNPRVQDQLRRELLEVAEQLNTADNDSEQLASILEGLPYLNGIFHETLRLYPTVPMTLRVCTSPTTLLGHHIPVGTTLVLSMMATNRSPANWGPDAAEFKPERWIDTDPSTGKMKPNNHGGATSNYGLLTFLAGPRSCIGQNFARAELRCLLAKVVSQFTLEDANAEPPVASGAITMKPRGGMWIRLRAVKGLNEKV